MPWLLRDGVVLAAIEVAEDRPSRRRGLLGRDGVEGALLLRPARRVHTMGMRFPIDVAYCVPCQPGPKAAPAELGELVASLEVTDTVTMGRWRIGRPRWRAACVIEAEAGRFDKWGLAPGDRVEVR